MLLIFVFNTLIIMFKNLTAKDKSVKNNGNLIIILDYMFIILDVKFIITIGFVIAYFIDDYRLYTIGCLEISPLNHFVVLEKQLVFPLLVFQLVVSLIRCVKGLEYYSC